MVSHLKSIVFLLILLPVLLVLGACESAEDRKAVHLEKGQALFAKGELKRAELEFRNVLQIDPQHAESLFMLAKLAEQQEDWRNAYSRYRRTVELAPDNHEARIKLGTLLLGGGNLDEAQAEADAVLAADAQAAGALALRGFIRLRRDDAAGALADAEAALARDPTHVEALALLAQIRVQAEDYQMAKVVLDTALEAHPTEKRFILGKAGVSERLGDAAGTRDSLERLIAIEPEDMAHRTRLAQYLTARGELDAAEQVLRKAVTALPDATEPKLVLVEFLRAQRDPATAVETLKGFIDAAPDNHALRFALAKLHISAGDIAHAEGVYRAVIERDAEGADGLRAKARLAALALGQDRTDEARTLADAVLAKDAQDSNALIVHAALALQDGDADQAVADLRTVLQNDPESTAALRLLAEAHVVLDKPALANDALRRLIDLAADNPAGYLRLALLRERMGDSEGAGVVLDELLGRDPTSAVAQTALARIQQAQPDTDALAKTAQQILRTRPEHPLGHYLSGVVQQRRGDAEASIPHFLTALEKEPRAAQALVALTRSYLALERYDAAEKQLRKALDDGADVIIATNLLGEVYLAADRRDEARAAYEKAIAERRGAPLAYERLAGLQLDDGDTAGAIETLRTGIEASQGSPLLTGVLPIVLERSGRIDEAIDAYEAVLAADPESVVAANNLAMLLANHRIGDPDSIARAVALVEPFEGTRQPALLDTLGWVHFRSGDYARAAALLERVQAAGEMTPERQFHLGMAYLKLGRKAEARPLLTAAAAAEQSFTGLEEARAALANLGS